MTISNLCLVDTNVLIYAADEMSPLHHEASILRDKGTRGEVPLCVTPQVLAEYFAIITDPKRVKQARTQLEAVMEIKKYFDTRQIAKILPNEITFPKFLELLAKYPVKGQEIFDLQLVATMLSNGISRIYTYNKNDFTKYQEIEVLSPDAVNA